MSEVFVSPGVYVRERDFSYYVSSVGQSALGLVGETKKGPAFLPMLVDNMNEFREKFGNTDPNKLVGYCAKSYFKYANQAYIVRVLGADKLRGDGAPEILPIHAYVPATNSYIAVATLLCDGVTSYAIESAATTNGDIGFSAHGVYSGTINVTDKTKANYIETLFPRTNPLASMATQHVFRNVALNGYTVSGTILASGAHNGAPQTITSSDALYVNGYSNASTPLIVSNVTNGTDAATGLFTINTISDGEEANKDIKIEIGDIDINNKTFSITVRKYSDTNASRQIYEKFVGVNLDPTSDNYILKQIGDNRDPDSANYTLKSNYIYVTVESGDHSNLVPAGFNRIVAPISGSTLVSGECPFPQWPMTTAYTTTTSTKRQCLGVNYTSLDEDHVMGGHSSQWNLAGSSSNYIKGFHLDSGASSTYYYPGISGFTTGAGGYATSEAKFLVPVLGGNDGWAWSATNRNHLLSGAASTSEETQWKAGIDLLSNVEEYDLNLLAVPGVSIKENIGVYAKDMVETRADCFYVGDMPSNYTTTTQAIADVPTAVDSSYCATYWPYVKIYDSDNSRDVWIPPTPQVIEALVYTDTISYPWFAPAGLNRGLLTDVARAKYRLTQDDREVLYENKINPIATFPGQGISIWGQKTLQTRTTALDRINVRRMMLYVEKVIAGASKYLVFEQNDSKTWDRFINMVQPVLDRVKIKRGLYDFRVIMDETTNTPDMIDRNQMVGQIYVKPTKTAEAILINFNILGTGASFDEV